MVFSLCQSKCCRMLCSRWLPCCARLFALACAVLLLVCPCWTFRVSYELDDRFVEYRKEAKWLVMFYAPWCHHCHKVEPVWEQVAQTFNQQEANLGLRVGKIDATKQTKSAQEFGVKGFPTIKYIHGDRIVTFEGERSREDIEDFALKSIGPAVRKISALSELRAAEKKQAVFFIYIFGKDSVNEEDPFRAKYSGIAEEFVTSNYFYEADSQLASGNIPFKETPAIAVYKDDHYFAYDGITDLKEWIRFERLSDFVKISGGNFYHLSELNKPIVAAVVEIPTYPTTRMEPDAQKLYDNVKNVALSHRDKYHQNFSFGYFDGNEIINQVVSQWIPIPSLIAYNPALEVYYLPNDSLQTVDQESIRKFVDGVLSGENKGIGGKGWFRKAYKFCYAIAAYFYKLFSTQPILASILFGLPLGILTIIIVMTYTNDCSDSSAEKDSDDDDSDHEKEE